MASYQMPPPKSFTFSRPEEWPKWIRRFQRFRVASGLSEKSSENQVNTLVYTMGDPADDILSSFGLSDEDKKKFEVVVERFERHFVKKRNVIFERAKFNQRKQEDGESVDDFVTALYCLSENCQYGDLRDEMIRDRIVVGLRDSSLSEKLQLEADLTLEKAVATARQRESVKKQQRVIRAEDSPSNVDFINSKQSHGKKDKLVRSKPPAFKQWQKPNPVTSSEMCTRCGKRPHFGRQQCPARDATCQKCHRRGHFRAMCRTKSVRAVGTEESEEEDAFVGVVEESTSLVIPTVSTGAEPWTVTVTLNTLPVEFQIDTGADVSVISEELYKKLKAPPLEPSTKSLVGPSQDSLQVCGQFSGTLVHKDSTVKEVMYVVKGLRKALIGRPAITALQLVSRVNTVDSTKHKIKVKFPKLFKGLGTIEGEYSIVLKQDATPYALATPRRIPLPLKSQVEQELCRMEQLGVIRKVDMPTEWCAGMVVVPKGNNKVRICVDLTKLNKSVCRERHILPSVEQTLAQLKGAKVFTKLDANSGFWQIKLSEKSALLTTFITPMGRYCFNRLPFGITSAPEFYQKKISHILSGLPGVVCMIDDILIFGQSQQEHDHRLESVLNRINQAGITLNPEKCEFSKRSVKFLGHVIDEAGIHPDPAKIQAIQQMKAPTNITELRRFLGMVTYLSKFSPNLSQKVKPLRDLLSSKYEWVWDTSQQDAFDQIRQELSNTPVLALYDPSKETTVSADASSYGLGAVLMQKQSNHQWKPVAYASRSLTATEQKYAQIEKEALGITWACERFSDYLIGMNFRIETDHKPLTSLLGVKNLEELPARIQRFRMRLMRYTFTVTHIPGKDLTIADTLSRAPTATASDADTQFYQDTEMFVNTVMSSLPATEKRLAEIMQKQEEDEVCRQLKQFCQAGWPDQHEVPEALKPYYSVSAELTIYKGLLMRSNRIVIPSSLRQDMLDRLHTGHQGITKCRQRAQQSVWWPNLSKQLEDLITNCVVCCRNRVQHAEPLMPVPFPMLPWQKVASDMFVWKNSHYLLVIDYFSRYIEIAKLSSESSAAVIKHMKSIFARHGIPQELVSDNGPQYSSREFANFSKEYGFLHTTSSPKFPQANGEAERGVQTVKNLLKKTDDPYLALLAYRATPLSTNGYSPAELLMNRKLRTTVPILQRDLKPKVPDYSKLKSLEKQRRTKQKRNFDSHHAARSLLPLKEGVIVWIPDHNCSGKVIKQLGTRSYLVKTPFGELRRNRRHLIASPNEQFDTDENMDSLPDLPSSSTATAHAPELPLPPPLPPPHDGTVYTRSGRASRPPKRYLPDSN